jgi:hypothetical protein
VSDLKPPITVDDIDRAPATLPEASGRNWQIEFNFLNQRFVELAETHAALKEQHDALKRKDSTRTALDDLIAPYSARAYWFMCAYSFLAFLVLMLDGFGAGGFSLSDEVLRIVVGSTAVTVIGLVGMVLTGVFVGARKY